MASSTKRAPTMHAAVLHGPGDLRVEERPVPEPAPREVLVEVSHCGVCGSDLHMVIEGWGQRGSVGGHEWSGRVVAAGDEVAGLAIGDAVVGGSPPPCGGCRACRARRPSLCDERETPGTSVERGAFARYVCADERSVAPVPDGLELRTAALTEPFAVALHAVSRSGVAPGQRALVTGAGPIGALAIAALRARGVTEIVVSEPNPGRQAVATRLGATSVVQPAALRVPTMAEPRLVIDGAVDVALECSGRAAAMVAACAQLVRGGTLVLVGAGIESPSFDPNRILLNELVITGSYEYDAGGFDEAAALLAAGAVDVDAILEPDDISLDALLTAMKGLAGGTIAGKVLVDPTLPVTPDMPVTPE